ncbi:MAG: peptide deformylase [Acidimicrobiia bacterium]|nr:peptide deformylase [Acidimicrobiia bacterium]
MSGASDASVAPVEAATEPLPLRFFGDQILRRVCEPVTAITDDLVELADRMLATMAVEGGVGLAAPQVGRPVRMFAHALAEQAPQILINPELVEFGEEEWVYSEGCLSVPGLFYDMVRPRRVHVRAYGLDGNEFHIEGEDLLGRVIQHEYDHLDGVLCVDRLTGDARRQATAELRQWVVGTLGANDPLLTGRAIAGLRKRFPTGDAPAPPSR